MSIGSYSKSIVAGLTAFSGAYTLANVDSVIDRGEWLTILVTTVLAVFATYSVPNAAQSDPAPSAPAAEVPAEVPTDDEEDAGDALVAALSDAAGKHAADESEGN